MRLWGATLALIALLATSAAQPTHVVGDGQLGWWQTTVVTPTTRGARVTRLGCTSDDAAEVEVSSAEPFPVRNALTELHVGDMISSLSRYADDGDTHTLIFLLTREQLLAISPDASGFVGYNPGNGHDVWVIGPLDLTSAVGCAEAAQPPRAEMRLGGWDSSP
jgi:hypothetical protein